MSIHNTCHWLVLVSMVKLPIISYLYIFAHTDLTIHKYWFPNEGIINNIAYESSNDQPQRE